MLVEFIALNFVDFVNDKGESVRGVNGWYLVPANNDIWVGQRPLKKWFSADYIPLFKKNGCGTYEVSTDLAGRVISVNFVG